MLWGQVRTDGTGGGGVATDMHLVCVCDHGLIRIPDSGNRAVVMLGRNYPRRRRIHGRPPMQRSCCIHNTHSSIINSTVYHSIPILNISKDDPSSASCIWFRLPPISYPYDSLVAPVIVVLIAYYSYIPYTRAEYTATLHTWYNSGRHFNLRLNSEVNN